MRLRLGRDGARKLCATGASPSPKRVAAEKSYATNAGTRKSEKDRGQCQHGSGRARNERPKPAEPRIIHQRTRSGGAEGEEQVSKRMTKQGLREARERFEREVAEYAFAHKDAPLHEIAEVFQIDRRELYAIRKRQGLSTRRIRKSRVEEKPTIES